MKKILVVVYGVVCYVVFLLAFFYAIGFIGNVFVPKSVDSGDAGVGIFSVIKDILLLSVFVLPYAVVANSDLRKWWVRVVPAVIERCTYVLLLSLVLLFIFWKWNSVPGVIWNAYEPAERYLIRCIYFAGWDVVLLSTFMINHFDLFGLRQVLYYFRDKPLIDLGDKTVWFYRIMRHPLRLGFLMIFWATPVMTVGHFVFAVAGSVCMGYRCIACGGAGFYVALVKR